MLSSSAITEMKALLSSIEEEKRLLDEKYETISRMLDLFESPNVDTHQEYESIDNSAAGLRDAIYLMLSESGPLHRKVIHDRLVERGMRVGGRDPVSNVSSHMISDPRFKSLGGGEWTLAEVEDDEEDTVPW